MHFRPISLCSLFQTTTNLNELLYSNLPTETLSQRITKAKLILDISQNELAIKTGLSRSTINELEAGYRDTISIDTLKKLITVLDQNIILDDYLKYILDQKNNIKALISIYGVFKLSKLLNCHRSTIQRYRDEIYQLPKSKFIIIKDLD